MIPVLIAAALLAASLLAVPYLRRSDAATRRRQRFATDALAAEARDLLTLSAGDEFRAWLDHPANGNRSTPFDTTLAQIRALSTFQETA